MRCSTTRRTFLRQGTTLAAASGLGNLDFLARLAPVSAAETHLPKHALGLQPDVEPIVRLIEETPREDLLEVVARRINGGLSYQTLLAALLLAGVKNVEPRPSVGHKFHAVLVVNSAHLASMASPDEHRWLPIFWALDYYKSAAARDVEERGDWTMEPVDERAVPDARQVPAALAAAMDAWDEEAADAAIVGLARTAGINEVYERLFLGGIRDFRSIGHKAIYVANSLRTLQCIGWRHAEPVLRSLVYALLMHEGGNPRDREAAADMPYRRNSERVSQVRADWRTNAAIRKGSSADGDAGATVELLAALRSSSNDEACALTVELLNRGVGPQPIWDALHLAAGELLMRQPGIVALHAVTSTNAMRHAYKTSGDDRTRLLLLLQNGAFLPMFREAMGGRGAVREAPIDKLAPHDAQAPPPEIDAIFAEVGRDRATAARMMLARLKRTGEPEEVINAARVLTFLKGTDAHDYKFSSAALEDYYLISPAWRDRYLASSTFNLCSSAQADNSLVARTRAALRA